MESEQPFIICKNLVKIYKVADLEVVALQGLDLEVHKGEMLSLVGTSGSGKSTLLNVIGGLDVPNAGDVTVGGFDLAKMSQQDRVKYKRDVIGFVWQQPGRNLLPYLTALENIELPMSLTSMSNQEKRKRAFELLELVDLEDRRHFRPDRLSGGEQQRVALAVALANNPSLLLADEPTGQLDSDAAAHVFESLRALNKAYQTTILIVTHDPQVALCVDRVIGIRDGRTSTEIRRERDHANGTINEDEWVILDQAGRMQIPQAYVDALDIRGRVKVHLEQDHLSIWPGRLVSDQEPDSSDPAQDAKTTLWPTDRTFEFPQSDPSITQENRPAVETHNLWRIFTMGAETVQAVRHVRLDVPTGALAVVKGRSGSGKTTLLNLIGGLDDPTRGIVLVNGQNLTEMSESDKVLFRRKHIGFVFQTFGLLPFLSARENIETPLRLLRTTRQERKQRADAILDLVGLSDRAQHRTFELSGGQQQRVALARALVTQPKLILADEPTGQLDTTTGSNIIALLKEIARTTGVTIIIASHDPKIVQVSDCVYELQDGLLTNHIA